MSRNTKHNSTLYSYLEQVGVLDKGNEAINDAKKTYSRIYKNKWIKKKRKTQKSFTLFFTHEEIKMITMETARHKFGSRTKYLKLAALSYSQDKYLVPNYHEIREIAQLLAMTYNSIQTMTDDYSIPLEVGKKLTLKIFELERAILPLLNNPLKK